MLVHDHKVETSEVFDFRETAPLQSTADMFTGLDDPNRKLVGNVTLFVYTPTCDPLAGCMVGLLVGLCQHTCGANCCHGWYLRSVTSVDVPDVAVHAVHFTDFRVMCPCTCVCHMIF